MLKLLKFWKRKQSDHLPLPARVIFPAPNSDHSDESYDIETDTDDNHAVTSDSNGAPLELTGHDAVNSFATQIAERVMAGVNDRENAADLVRESIQQFHAEVENRIADLARQLSTTIAEDIEVRGKHVDGLIGRSLKPVADRVARAVVKDADSHWIAIRKELSESSIRAAQDSAVNPIIDQQIAMLDRVRDERAFLATAFRKDNDLTLDANARQYFEQYDAAIASVVTEILMNLRALGVEQTQGNAGPFDPKTQRVVGIEETSRADLDGHVARIVRAGFTRNGAQIRPELVIVYRKGEEKS